ncbi:MAG: hypothetical protein PHQ23_16695, partial [Candidatus Wallbacteria bacterium]|nr:hypothetical protein [Candidatus Wallbacteria bacterium]
MGKASALRMAQNDDEGLDVMRKERNMESQKAEGQRVQDPPPRDLLEINPQLIRAAARVLIMTFFVVMGLADLFAGFKMESYHGHLPYDYDMIPRIFWLYELSVLALAAIFAHYMTCIDFSGIEDAKGKALVITQDIGFVQAAAAANLIYYSNLNFFAFICLPAMNYFVICACRPLLNKVYFGIPPAPGSTAPS